MSPTQQTAIAPSGTVGPVLLADRGYGALLKLYLARSGYTPVRCFGRASTAPVAIVLRDAVWLVATAVSGGRGGWMFGTGQGGVQPAPTPASARGTVAAGG